MLTHCERDGVKLAVAQDEPLTLGVTEVEVDSVNDGECVPL